MLACMVTSYHSNLLRSNRSADLNLGVFLLNVVSQVPSIADNEDAKFQLKRIQKYVDKHFSDSDYSRHFAGAEFFF